MPTEKADFAWYSAASRKQGLPPRCPIAQAELCPRYFYSLDALGRERLFTKIPTERSASLERKWKMFQPVVAEDEPWADKHSINHFCPEVCYDSFGYFASDMHEFVDEIDRDWARDLHKREGASEPFDSRWEYVWPRHYTECREYSVHGTFAAGKPSRKPARPGEVSPKRRWQVLARDAFTCLYCGRKPPEVALQVDHVVSVNDGGSDDLDNLVTACHECNGGKGPSSL